MERSQRLGHCICEPKRPCPCEVFRTQHFCPCAGERPEPIDLSTVKLTSLVHNAGCASKIAPADLEAVLRRLPQVTDPAVISGLAAADDAAIYRIADNLCLVQTVDVFTPCVDDPFLFGRICAANCLSDIYAMGGEPRTALSVLAFPSETLDGEIMHRMLAGAMETLAQAGVALIGGHSIKDQEIKLGFAITGLIDPAAASALDAPRAGDLLVLTKPLGTGVLTFCQQIGRPNPAGMAAAQDSMAALNKAPAQAMRAAGASACTDITGFGLFGHLPRLLKNLSARIYAEALPSFEGALEALRQGAIPGAVERNREFVGARLTVGPGVDEALVNLGFDAQTSGGLLIAIAPERLQTLLGLLEQNFVNAVVIGKLDDAAPGQIIVEPGNGAGIPSAPPQPCAATELSTQSDALHSPDCCAGLFAQPAPPAPAPAIPGTAAEAQRAFGAMMRAVANPGALDARTKELLLFALIIQSRCAPCFDAHYQKARQMGITQPELDEAAWCAIAMGGAPVKMFYQGSLGKSRA